jgi:serine/threonine protein kinase
MGAFFLPPSFCLNQAMTNSRYRILGEVGQGQFGQVFCGSDRTTGQLVAMKKLEHRRFPTHKFLRELAVLARLQHPNIVGLHGLEYSATGRYLVLDYCHGGTLRQLMESKLELDLAQKLQLIRDILLGLEHIHQHGIIHCDLKPENILLNVVAQGWSAQIADFGIAHFLEPSDTQNHSSGDTGSPAYMAPERFYGKYSPESDLYAIGVLLFEIVVGRRPFSGMPVDVMKAHLNQPLRIPKSVPSILRLIISKALQKLPQNRYGSATSMRMMVETVIANLNYSGPLSEPFVRTETREDEFSVTPKDDALKPSSACVQEISFQADHLHQHQVLEGSVCGLWLRAQGCIIAVLRGNETHLSVFQPGKSQDSPARLEPIGTFPGQLAAPNSALVQTLDLDPQGRWIAILQNEDGLMPPEAVCHEQSMHSQTNCTLQFFKLSSAQQVCRQPLNNQADHLCFASSGHTLLSRSLPSTTDQTHSTELQLWNRRGQRYWSHTLPTHLQQAIQISANRVFALTDEVESMGLWIDLFPFKVRQISLGIQADWIGETRWGYILASHTGSMIYLNRRGRIMAKATLPIPTGATVRAIATHRASNLLWFVIAQVSGPDRLCTLDLALHLPKVLLKL